MNYSATVHPPEELLMEWALKGGNREIEEHCGSCDLCAGKIAEYKKVADAVVSSLDDEEVPRLLEHHILKMRENRTGISGLLQSFLTNPLIMAAAIIIMLLILYYLLFSVIL